jgi:hypothetical protein
MYEQELLAVIEYTEGILEELTHITAHHYA